MQGDVHSFRGHVLEVLSFCGALTRWPRAASPDRHRLVIYGRGRSGSTLFVELLNRLAGFHCDGEIFHYPIWKPRELLRNRERMFGGQHYAFKLLSYQLLEIQGTRSQYLTPRQLYELGYELIHIKRNPLYQSVSVLRAVRSGEWHRLSGSATRNGKFLIDLAALEAQLERNRRLEAIECEQLAGLRHRVVDYERNLETPEQQRLLLEELQREFRTSISDASPALRKIGSEAVFGAVSNPAELARFVVDRDLQHWLKPVDQQCLKDYVAAAL